MSIICILNQLYSISTFQVLSDYEKVVGVYYTVFFRRQMYIHRIQAPSGTQTKCASNGEVLYGHGIVKRRKGPAGSKSGRSWSIGCPCRANAGQRRERPLELRMKCWYLPWFPENRRTYQSSQKSFTNTISASSESP